MFLIRSHMGHGETSADSWGMAEHFGSDDRRKGGHQRVVHEVWT